MKNASIFFGLSILFSLSSLAAEDVTIEKLESTAIEQEIYNVTHVNLRELVSGFGEISNRMNLEVNITSLNSVGRHSAFWDSGITNNRRVSCSANLYAFEGNYRIYIDKKLYDIVNFSGFTVDTDKRSLGLNYPANACADPRKFTAYHTWGNNKGMSENTMNTRVRKFFVRNDLEYTRDQQPGQLKSNIFNISNSEGIKLKLVNNRNTIFLAERLPLFVGKESANFTSSKTITVHAMQTDASLSELLSTSLSSDCRLVGDDRSLPKYFVVTPNELSARLVPFQKAYVYGSTSPHLSLWTNSDGNAIFTFDDQDLLKLLDVLGFRSNAFEKYDCGGIIDLLKSKGNL